MDGSPRIGNQASVFLSPDHKTWIHIYILNSSRLGDAGVSKLFSQLPLRYIVLLEDVDTVGLDCKITNKG